MWKPISARIESAFGKDVSDEEAATFLAELRVNRREIAAQQRRDSWLILSLVAILILIGQGEVTQANVLFVQIESLGLVGLAIPPVVGYLLVNQYLLLLDENYASAAHDGILALRQPRVTEERLELLLAPPTSAWYQGGKVALLYGKGGRRSDGVGVTIGVFTTSLPVVVSNVVVFFLLYELFTIYGWGHVGAWLSAVILIGEWMFLGLLAAGTRWPWGREDDPSRS